MSRSTSHRPHRDVYYHTAMPVSSGPFVSRGGLKLAAAIDAFGLDVTDKVCADLGCSTGGFTDCLLQRGVTRVYALDTGYGVLDWTLRNDPRVIILERTNAIHFDPATIDAKQSCEVVTIDLGWTRQQYAVPAALRWLSRANDARIVTLIKPQYEASEHERRSGSRHGVLDAEDARRVADDVCAALPSYGVTVLELIASPIRGGASRGREGNIEFLALLARSAALSPDQ
jgi:23S rRNA (cytidine1920-2'-O)/16S rRNA (cytidine1409-2'-O)-methyltransferase